MKKSPRHIKNILVYVIAAFTVVLPWTGFGGAVVTNSAELIRCLGYNGIAGIDFEIDATVVWETSAATKTFYVKTSDGYTRLTDKKFWPQMHLRNGDVIKASGTTASMSNGFVNADCHSIEIIRHSPPEKITDATVKDVLSGRYPFRPVRIKGTVRDTFADEIDHKYRHVIISSDSESIGLSIPSEENTGALTHLIGAEIRATGCYTPSFGGYRKLSRC